MTFLCSLEWLYYSDHDKVLQLFSHRDNYSILRLFLINCTDDRVLFFFLSGNVMLLSKVKMKDKLMDRIEAYNK